MTDTRVRMVPTIRRDSFAVTGPNVWNSLRVCDQLEHLQLSVRNVLNRLRRLRCPRRSGVVEVTVIFFTSVSQRPNYCELRLENIF